MKKPPFTIENLEIDEFEFTVEVLHLINQPADPMCRDSADDARGIREIEWRLTYAIEYDDDGRIKECGELPGNLQRLAYQHSDLIEANIWAWIDKENQQ